MSILRFSGSTSALNLPDPVFAGGGGEVFEQDGADAAALVGVGDVEGDLGLRGIIEPVVAADAHDFAADGDHQGHPVLVVHLGEPLEFLARRAWT